MNSDELIGMLKKFKLPQLKELLTYAGRNLRGRKDVLLKAAEEVAVGCSPQIATKIKELYSQCHQPRQLISQSFAASTTSQELSSCIVFEEWTFFNFQSTIIKPTDICCTIVDEFDNNCTYKKEIIFIIEMKKSDSHFVLRLCLLDKSISEQQDNVPTVCKILVNTIVLTTLPSVIPHSDAKLRKRHPYPIVIPSELLRIGINKLTIEFVHDKTKNPYILALFLAEKLSTDFLLQKLKDKGHFFSTEIVNIVNEILKNDKDISLEPFKVSLNCPLTMTKMTIPCRVSTCEKHVRCFDAKNFLELNKIKPKWKCPICDKEALYKNLQIDTFYLNVLKNVSEECKEIQLFHNMEWSEIPSKENKTLDNQVRIVPNFKSSSLIPDDKASSVTPNCKSSPVTPNNKSAPVIPNNKSAPVIPNNKLGPVTPDDKFSPVIPDDILDPVIADDIPDPVILDDKSALVIPNDKSAPVTPVKLGLVIPDDESGITGLCNQTPVPHDQTPQFTKTLNSAHHNQIQMNLFSRFASDDLIKDFENIASLNNVYTGNEALDYISKILSQKTANSSKNIPDIQECSNSFDSTLSNASKVGSDCYVTLSD